jgi:sensor histidine kinase YesM
MNAEQPIINQYIVSKDDLNETIIDTAYDYFQTYFAAQKDDVFLIEKEFDNISFRLTQYMLQLVDYKNISDTTIILKFYSPIYRYHRIAELAQLEDCKLYLKNSTKVKADKQFFTINLLPKSTLRLALVYKPVSFKDYADHKNTVFKYQNIHNIPVQNELTNKRNFGFTVEYLFILGMIFLMFIFYVIAYYYLKDKIYLYYTFYLVSTFIQVLYMSQYILTRNLKMFNITGNSGVDEASKGLMIFFYSVFYKQAFHVTAKEKILYFSVEALKFISLLYVGVIAAGYFFTLTVYNEPFLYSFYRFPIFFFSILILIITYRIKDKNLFQQFVFFGSITYTFFTALSTMQKLNFPIKDFYVDVNMLYLGVALELIIFSIALIIRIKDSFLNSERLKDELIIKLKESEEFIKNENVLLEYKINERVYEIEQKNIQIEEQKKQALLQQFEKEKAEIRMLALSSQMNPHFIFNCMNAIQHAILTNNREKAASLLNDFALLIRMVLQNSVNVSISLSDEIDLIRQYLNLEQNRLNHSFDYEICIDNDIEEEFIKIPNMMIQPLLENSIWHGFKDINYKGRLLISFSLFENNNLICSIKDNGKGYKSGDVTVHSVKNEKPMAIAIIRKRLDLINKTSENNASLDIIDIAFDSENLTGTQAVLTLPLY